MSSPGNWLINIRNLSKRYNEYKAHNKLFMNGNANQPVSQMQWKTLINKIKILKNKHDVHLLEIERTRLPSYPRRPRSSINRHRRTVSRRTKSI